MKTAWIISFDMGQRCLFMVIRTSGNIRPAQNLFLVIQSLQIDRDSSGGFEIINIYLARTIYKGQLSSILQHISIGTD